ncbi:MAG: hypothetical protein QOE70_6718 [Chthoniobacter sp.]|jgi:DNA-binding response OmpR family regulator|nr:hypothetical protein [Chthoniobacter sp.]
MSLLATAAHGNLTASSHAASSSPPVLRALPTGSPVSAGKVLLLEDDLALKGILSDFLSEAGLEVCAVADGVQGVHNVLAGDFEFILCDMNMPTLSGEMFFRAVERLRPHLCDRFVFMTGYRGNDKVNQFIESIGGSVLTKPFNFDDLLELVAFIRIKSLLLAD